MRKKARSRRSAKTRSSAASVPPSVGATFDFGAGIVPGIDATPRAPAPPPASEPPGLSRSAPPPEPRREERPAAIPPPPPPPLQQSPRSPSASARGSAGGFGAGLLDGIEASLPTPPPILPDSPLVEDATPAEAPAGADDADEAESAFEPDESFVLPPRHEIDDRVPDEAVSPDGAFAGELGERPAEEASQKRRRRRGRRGGRRRGERNEARDSERSSPGGAREGDATSSASPWRLASEDEPPLERETADEIGFGPPAPASPGRPRPIANRAVAPEPPRSPESRERRGQPAAPQRNDRRAAAPDRADDSLRFTGFLGQGGASGPAPARPPEPQPPRAGEPRAPLSAPLRAEAPREARPAPSPPRGAMVRISLVVNGRPVSCACDSRQSLLDVLRLGLGLTGTKRGCDSGECGACTVLVEGRAVTSCLVLAVTCDGARVETIEGLSSNGSLHPIQRAFVEEDALQCGFCTPGQVMSLKGLLDRVPDPTDAEIEEALLGNLCRCGAYSAIRRAARRAARETQEGSGPGRSLRVRRSDR